MDERFRDSRGGDADERAAGRRRRDGRRRSRSRLDAPEPARVGRRAHGPRRRRRARADAPLAPRTSWPRRCWTCSRARSSGSGRSSTTASTTTSCCPRPLTPDDLPAIEARMRESIAADHPFELSELTPAEARAFLVERDQPFKVEIIDDLLAAAERDGTAMPPTTFYRQGPFIDLCRGPHVASTGKIGPFKLLGTAGAYWRGDEKRPMLQRVYGTAWATQEELDAVPVAARGGEEARPPAARRRSSTCSASTTSRRARPSGIPRASSSGAPSRGAMRELQARRGYQEVSTPIVVSRAAVAPVGPLGPLRREHVHRRVREPAVQPQADELPGDRRSSTARTCGRTATCRCASASSAGSTATSGPARSAA